jgi:acyl carrier protein
MNSSGRLTGGDVRNSDEVLRDVCDIVANQLGMEAARIQKNHTLIEDLGCDSLDVVEISMELEEHFDISIPDEFADSARTIDNVVNGVLQLLARARD